MRGSVSLTKSEGEKKKVPVLENVGEHGSISTDKMLCIMVSSWVLLNTYTYTLSQYDQYSFYGFPLKIKQIIFVLTFKMINLKIMNVLNICFIQKMNQSNIFLIKQSSFLKITFFFKICLLFEYKKKYFNLLNHIELYEI